MEYTFYYIVLFLKDIKIMILVQNVTFLMQKERTKCKKTMKNLKKKIISRNIHIFVQA